MLNDVQLAHVAPIERKRSDGRGHRPESGIRAATRELGIQRDDARRLIAVAFSAATCHDPVIDAVGTERGGL